MRLIEPNYFRSKQDVGIQEAIEWFDQESKLGNWDALTAQELAFISEQIAKCADSFTYCARNYFRLVNKEGVEGPFEFWETQELILDSMQTLQDRNLPAKLLILKGRQVGCSTLIEALIAWYTIFRTNVNAMVSSYDRPHTAFLFGLMQDFYDYLPWWLKPMVANREFKKGLSFDNPDYEYRRLNPGNNSKIQVVPASSEMSVGRGFRINAAHFSEIAFWGSQARRVIEADARSALVNHWTTVAVIETTGNGASGYFYNLWKEMVALGDRAGWLPKFYPAFMEPSRVLAPPQGWRIKPEEERDRESTMFHWLCCDNSLCGRYKERTLQGQDIIGSTCQYCNTGILKPLVLTDEQLYWRESERLNSRSDEDSRRLFLQEMAITPEQSFQATGNPVFTTDVIEYVQSTVRPPRLSGSFDAQYKFHAYNPVTQKCCVHGCDMDHRFDNQDVHIYHLPEPGRTYYIGVDVSLGVGEDYSAITVLQLGNSVIPDRQVASYRSNSIDPIQLAFVILGLGRWYNEAEVAVELNKYDSCATYLRLNLQYPRLYRWKHLDSQNMLSSKLGWVTNQRTKPRLVIHAQRWMSSRQVIIHSANLAHEIKTYQRDKDNPDSMEAAPSSYDDELMSYMIALYCAHEVEFDDKLGYVPIQQQLTIENARYVCVCRTCQKTMPVNKQGEIDRCRECGSRHLEFHMTAAPVSGSDVIEELLDGENKKGDGVLTTY